VITSGNAVYVTVAIARWEKAKSQIQWIHDQISVGNMLCHKTLKRYRGFLVYISRTYPSLVPYLKGIHLALDSWRPNRNQEGWRVNTLDLDGLGCLSSTSLRWHDWCPQSCYASSPFGP
jgi:hypothetical protein